MSNVFAQSPIRLLKQKEVAALVSKSEAWLERMRWLGGGIPYKKIGRSVRYDEREVLRWISEQPTRTSTSDLG
jgi:predicted DNA-binding transcriptional regulator AlpA